MQHSKTKSSQRQARDGELTIRLGRCQPLRDDKIVEYLYSPPVELWTRCRLEQNHASRLSEGYPFSLPEVPFFERCYEGSTPPAGITNPVPLRRVGPGFDCADDIEACLG